MDDGHYGPVKEEFAAAKCLFWLRVGQVFGVPRFAFGLYSPPSTKNACDRWEIRLLLRARSARPTQTAVPAVTWPQAGQSAESTLIHIKPARHPRYCYSTVAAS
jgi:hypothetical protein